MKVTIGKYPSNRPFYDLLRNVGVGTKMNHKIHDILRKLRLIERPQIIKVQIEAHDTWSMDFTLAYIIHPMLVQLKETMQGYPSAMDSGALDSQCIELDDSDDFNTKVAKWKEIMDKMIWSFEQKLLDNEPTFWSEPVKFDDNFKIVSKGVYDRETAKEYADRLQEGFDLFGKYFQSLWD
jgi:hypothetical protein